MAKRRVKIVVASLGAGALAVSLLAVDPHDLRIRYLSWAIRTFGCEDADLRIVLEVIAKTTDTNILISDEVQGSVTLSARAVRDSSWEEILLISVQQCGYTLSIAEGDDKTVVRVVHPGTRR